MGCFPYIVLITRGNHSHHPPYPLRLPQDIADDVIAAIKRTDILGMTARMSRLYSAYAAHPLMS
jgi:hypothetical protein